MHHNISQIDQLPVDQHIMNEQSTTINISQILVDSIKILDSTQCKEILKTLESIIIQNKQPTINKISFTTGEVILKCI